MTTPIQGGGTSQPQTVTTSEGSGSSSPTTTTDTIGSSGGVGVSMPFLTAGVYLDAVVNSSTDSTFQLSSDNITNNMTYARLFQAVVSGNESYGALRAIYTQVSTESQNLFDTMNIAISDVNGAAATLNKDEANDQSTGISDVNTGINNYATAVTAYNGAIGLADAYYNNTVVPDQAAVTADPTAANQATLAADTNTYNGMVTLADNNMTAAETTFSGVLDTYNTYANGLNSALSQDVTNYANDLTNLANTQTSVNADLPAVNADRIADGIPALPSFNLAIPSPSNIPALPSGTSSLTGSTYLNVIPPVAAPSLVANPYPISTGLINAVNPTPYSVIISQYFAPLAALIPGASTSLLQSLVAGVNYNEARTTTQQGVNPLGPRSYISHTSATPSPSTNAGGGESSLAQAGGGTHLERAISDAIVRTEQNLFQLEVAQGMVGKIQNLGSSAGNLTSLLAASKTLGIFGISGSSPAAINAAYAATNSQAISDLIQSGVIQNGVSQIVEEDLGGLVDQATLDRVTAVASAVVAQDLIKGVLSDAQPAFGTPGLSGQVLANGVGVSTSDLSTNATGGLTVGDVLNNSQQNQQLQTTLANQLAVQDNISQQKAQEIVSTAFSSLNTENGAITLSQLEQQLAASFVAQGISDDISTTLNTITTAFVTADQEASEQVHAAVLSSQNTQDILTQQLQGVTANAQATAQQILSNLASDTSIQTNAEFEAALQSQLAQYNISSAVAQQISIETVGLTLASSPYVSPLFNPTLQSVLSLPEIQTQLHQQVVGMVEPTVGTVKSGQIADAATFSTTSLYESYRQNQNILFANGATTGQENTLADLRSDVASAYQDYSLDRGPRIIDGLLHTGATSLESSGVPAERGHRKSVDILV
jgi:hypothetical protein